MRNRLLSSHFCYKYVLQWIWICCRWLIGWPSLEPCAHSFSKHCTVTDTTQCITYLGLSVWRTSYVYRDVLCSVHTSMITKINRNNNNNDSVSPFLMLGPRKENNFIGVWYVFCVEIIHFCCKNFTTSTYTVCAQCTHTHASSRRGKWEMISIACTWCCRAEKFQCQKYVESISVVFVTYTRSHAYSLENVCARGKEAAPLLISIHSK